MYKRNLVKIFLCIAALVFTAKPFIGFTIFNRAHQPDIESIFVKVFSKRKLEFSEKSKFSITAVQKKLADPVDFYTMRYAFLLSILLPLIFLTGIAITDSFLRRLKPGLLSSPPVWLLNSNLTI